MLYELFYYTAVLVYVLNIWLYHCVVVVCIRKRDLQQKTEMTAKQPSDYKNENRSASWLSYKLTNTAMWYYFLERKKQSWSILEWWLEIQLCERLNISKKLKIALVLG